MPRFQNLNEAFWYIGENPLEYLSDKSLAFFNAFWIGYQWRHEVGFTSATRFDLQDGFSDFMCRKFKVPSNRNSLGIAEFYSKNQSSAFELWFSCLEEFIRLKEVDLDVKTISSDNYNFFQQVLLEKRKCDFFVFLKDVIFKRIVGYVGSKSFTLATNMISGWLRATKDFDLQESEQEITFKNFQKYIEDRPFWLRETDDSGLPPTPPWNKIIWQWTAHIQKEEKALEMFSAYFDEFAFQGKGFVEYVEFHWKVHNGATDEELFGKF